MKAMRDAAEQPTKLCASPAEEQMFDWERSGSVDELQKSRATGWCCAAPARGEWKLTRLDVISAIEPRQWPVGQIELHHRTRGRTLEIATGAGGTDAIFNALAQHFGINASLAGLSVRFEPESDTRSGFPSYMVMTDLLVDDMMYRGVAQSGDLLLSSAAAYLDALSMAHAERAIANDWRSRPKAQRICQGDFDRGRSAQRAN